MRSNLRNLLKRGFGGLILIAILVALSGFFMSLLDSTGRDTKDPEPTTIASPSPTLSTSPTSSPDEIKQQLQEKEDREQRERQAQERQREQEAARVNPRNYELITEKDFALMLKNPNYQAGRKIQLFGEVTQFDTRTGPAMFLANTSAIPTRYNEATMIRAQNPSILTYVAKGDLVRMYVEVVGTTTYETTFFGTRQTVPVFNVNIIDACPKHAVLKVGPAANNYPSVQMEPACSYS
jgi:hypothetical protein